MKKNNTMRVAAGLAVAALLSTCLVSGTFAKYTTSKTSTDGARVAMFGVEVVPTSNSMFKTSYATTDTNGYTGNSVVSSNTDKMVAPGTEGGLTAMTLKGKPEVAVRVTNKSEVTLTGWTIDTNTYYCPLQVKVGEETLKGTDYSSAALFEQAIEQKIDAYTKDYAPGTDLSAEHEAAPVVSWTWAFEDKAVDADQTDAKNTKLGDAGTAKIGINVTTTVTQID